MTSNCQSGKEWQTDNNVCPLEPHVRDSDGMCSVCKGMAAEDIKLVDAVFLEGILRGVNVALSALKHNPPPEISPSPLRTRTHMERCTTASQGGATSFSNSTISTRAMTRLCARTRLSSTRFTKRR